MYIHNKYMSKYFFIFVLPTLLAFSISFVIPFILGIVLSFTDFTSIIDAKWVGISNYIEAFSNKDFLNALWFTVRIAIVTVITVNLFALGIALLLTRNIRGTNTFRAIFFMPNLIGGIVLGYIWQLLINGVLYKFGVALTYKATYGFWGLVILMNWQMIGYMMVIYIAAIQSIPRTLIEAASIDGATPFQILTKIKLPYIMPSITICLFLTMANSFKNFDSNLALTAGAPSKKTAMLALDIYNTFYNTLNGEGVGQAKAVVFFLIVAVIAFLQLKLTRRKEADGI